MELTSVYFSSDNMNEIQQAFLSIQNTLIANGYDSAEIITETITPQYLPNKIKSLFNNQELNTQKIDIIADWVNPYSKVFEWNTKQGNIFPFINRWYQWVDYNQKIVNNEIRKRHWLLDTDGEKLYNIDGDEIITIEGYFNEGVS